MSYQITTFDGIALPTIMSVEDMSSASIPSTIQVSMGAAFDWRGSGRQFPVQQQITIRGAYVGTTHADLITKINQLKGLIGKQATLIRANFSDGTTQTRIARLLSVKINQDAEQNTALFAEVEAVFETPTGGWRASTATTASSTASGSRTISITMGGNIECQDAIVTATGSITSLTIVSAPIGVNLSWSGTATGSGNLTIDCGAKTIVRGSANQYNSGFITSSHTARGWLPLAIGTNTITVSTTLTSTVTITAFAVTA